MSFDYELKMDGEAIERFDKKPFTNANAAVNLAIKHLRVINFKNVKKVKIEINKIE